MTPKANAGCVRQAFGRRFLRALHSLLVMSAFLLLGSCAPGTGTSPKEITCRALNMQEVKASGARVEKAVFSVAPPATETWCLSKDKSTPMYFSHPLFGRALTERPSEDETAHTLALYATELHVPSYHLQEADDLKVFVEKWLRNGQVMRFDGDLMIVDMTVATNVPIIEIIVWQHDRSDAECVRYDLSREEHGNPNVPGKVLVLHDFGMVCRLHENRPIFVTAVLTERQVQSGSIDPGYFAGLKADVAEPFFQSLQFQSSAGS